MSEEQKVPTENLSLAERKSKIKGLMKEIKELELATGEKYWYLGKELLAYQKDWIAKGREADGYPTWTDHIDQLVGLSVWKKAKRIAELKSPKHVVGLTLGEAWKIVKKQKPKQDQAPKTARKGKKELTQDERQLEVLKAAHKASVAIASIKLQQVLTEEEIELTKQFLLKLNNDFPKALYLVNHVANIVTAEGSKEATHV